MSLKCTVFGHRFGAPDVERTREEEGSEVVTTVREVEACTRCGHERVVSENKEVKTIASETTESPADPPPASEGHDSPPSKEPVASETPAEPEGEDAEIIEEQPDEPLVQEAEPTEKPDPVAESDPTPETVETAPTASGQTDTEGDDAVIMEETTTDREPGAWPEEPEDEGTEWEPPTDPVASEPDVEQTGEAVSVPDGTFHCPECGFSTPVEASSLREGDFCPECHTGSLAHEPDRR